MSFFCIEDLFKLLRSKICAMRFSYTFWRILCILQSRNDFPDIAQPVKAVSIVSLWSISLCCRQKLSTCQTKTDSLYQECCHVFPLSFTSDIVLENDQWSNLTLLWAHLPFFGNLIWPWPMWSLTLMFFTFKTYRSHMKLIFILWFLVQWIIF